MKVSNKLLNEINLLIKSPYEYIENSDINIIIKIIKYAKYKYFNESPIISDTIYDLLTDYLEKYGSKEQKKILHEIGETVQINKHKLPFHMGSMDKIKPSDTNKLTNWLAKYKGPYLISDKLDGISAMIEYKNNKAYGLYTRGNGQIGMNISHLIKYIDSIPKELDIKDITIRGELIMSIKKFKMYSEEMANPRNLVSGQINKKTPNKNILTDINFIAYEIISPWSDFKTQYKTLEKLNFYLPNYKIIKDLTIDKLSNLLKNHKKTSSYEIDGIIISDTNFHKRYLSGNPDYSFAFKELLEDQIVEVKVLDVEWNVSKDGYIKPKLILEPTKLSGVTIKNVTAFNAKFIKDNKLGPGSIIKLTRSGDVIPHIVDIIKSTKPKFPKGDWHWNTSGVDIIIKKKNYQQKIKEITFFLKNLDVKYIDEKIVEKLYTLGYTDINKYFSFDSKHLENKEGFKETMINKINTEITNALDNMTLLKLMTASNIFGHGIGEKKLKKILDLYPDIILKKYLLTANEFYNLIINIYGFDRITTDQFIKNMRKFCNFFFDLPRKYRNKVLIEIIVYNKFAKILRKQTLSPVKEKQFVFSNFRNKEWEKYIETNGGKITSTISKNTNYLVTTKDQIENATNNKVIKAKELGIEIIDKDKFQKKFIK